MNELVNNYKKNPTHNILGWLQQKQKLIHSVPFRADIKIQFLNDIRSINVELKTNTPVLLPTVWCDDATASFSL